MKTEIRINRQKMFSIVPLLFFASLFLSAYLIEHIRITHKLWNKICVRISGGELLGTQNVVLQENINECGIAALTMILKHFNIVRDVDELKKKVLLSDIGMTMAECVKIAKQEGLKVKALHIDWSVIRTYPTPFLTLIRNRHYVVVDKVDVSKVFVRDPAIGLIIYGKGVWEKIWNGQVLIFKQNRISFNDREGISLD